MEVAISVIIPVYNVELYIHDCLQSVMGQDLLDIEILCIEDASIDKSLSILGEYSKLDTRIRIIENVRNRGLSYSRNRGMEEAKGRYIYFLDSDDMLKEGALQYLYKMAQDEEVDAIFFHMDLLNELDIVENPTDSRTKNEEIEVEIVTGVEFLIDQLKKKGYSPMVPLQFWRRDYLIQNNIRFIEGILHEDVPYTFKALLPTKRIKMIQDSLYIYRKRADSLTTSLTKKNHIKRLEGLYLGIMDMLLSWEQYEFDRETDEAIHKYILERFYHLRETYGSHKQNQSVVEAVDEDLSKKERCLYEMMLHQYSTRMIDATLIESKIEEIRKYQHVVVYGAGLIAKELIEIFAYYDIVVSAVGVSKKENNPTSLMGHRIYGIHELTEYKENGIVVLAVSKRYSEKMKSLLYDYGYQNIVDIN